MRVLNVFILSGAMMGFVAAQADSCDSPCGEAASLKAACNGDQTCECQDNIVKQATLCESCGVEAGQVSVAEYQAFIINLQSICSGNGPNDGVYRDDPTSSAAPTSSLPATSSAKPSVSSVTPAATKSSSSHTTSGTSTPTNVLGAGSSNANAASRSSPALLSVALGVVAFGTLCIMG